MNSKIRSLTAHMQYRLIMVFKKLKFCVISLVSFSIFMMALLLVNSSIYAGELNKGVEALSWSVDYIDDAVFGDSRLKRLGFAVTNTFELKTTSSAEYTPVPDMVVDMVVKEGPVVIEFCATVNNGGKGSVSIKPLVKGADILPFGAQISRAIQFSTDAGTSAHCFKWIAVIEVAGLYTFEMLWSKAGGGISYLQSGILTIEGR